MYDTALCSLPPSERAVKRPPILRPPLSCPRATGQALESLYCHQHYRRRITHVRIDADTGPRQHARPRSRGSGKLVRKDLGLQADKHRVSGPGLLIAFQSGEPVHRAPELHVGFRVQSKAALAQWAQKFGAEITNGAEFCTFRTFDPEGNCVEIYCRADA